MSTYGVKEAPLEEDKGKSSLFLKILIIGVVFVVLVIIVSLIVIFIAERGGDDFVDEAGDVPVVSGGGSLGNNDILGEGNGGGSGESNSVGEVDIPGLED